MTSSDDRKELLGERGIGPHEQSPPRCAECGHDADPALECRRCAEVLWDVCADAHDECAEGTDSCAPGRGSSMGDEGRAPEPGPPATPALAQLLTAIAAEAEVALLDGDAGDHVGRLAHAVEQLAVRIGVEERIRRRLNRCALAVLAGWPERGPTDEVEAWENRAALLRDVAWVCGVALPRVARWLPPGLADEGERWASRTRELADAFTERAVALALEATCAPACTVLPVDAR